MRQQESVPFAELTTLRVGGRARRLITADTTDDVIAVVKDCDRTNTPMLVIGGGSNVVVSDDGFDGVVLSVRTSGLRVVESRDTVRVDIAAGESWDRFVAHAVAQGWSGVETLAGIPGLVGATPLQNVGAYGQQVSDVLTTVDVWDRASDARRTLSTDQCVFGYRSSVFKHHVGQYVVLGVQLELPRSGQSQPIAYAELARHLDVEVGATVEASVVREAVLALRQAKGMVLDEADPDTWSVGSFFTNPIVAAGRDVPSGAPSWPAPDGATKVSAAWLIEQAGFTRGFGADVGSGRARLSYKHTLAITNRGGASTSEIIHLARVIKEGVRREFDIDLVVEPTLVGVHL